MRAPGRRHRREQREGGAVTAETALALPGLVVVLAAMLWGLGAVTAQLECVDAARSGARALARGEEPGAVRAAALAAAPAGASVALSTEGAGLVSVTVRARVEGPGSLLGRLGVDLRARAVSAAEPSVGGAP